MAIYYAMGSQLKAFSALLLRRICVAMPIYYATGSRLKAFLWAALPGLLEPLGGLIGYLALHDNNDLAFAIVFGLVSGMMVYISIRCAYMLGRHNQFSFQGGAPLAPRLCCVPSHSPSP